ncbi:hypothetical protein [uncultured Leifsonia sp.]|jgi:hypothetical protein|uniref:hypothetical protein n=1 Tax=uncultured Leifsonia sp. TaxID=340359 RepID=UPI0025FE5F8F|nr:hypothetical protein [uncultured Leifsonia sp.]
MSLVDTSVGVQTALLRGFAATDWRARHFLTVRQDRLVWLIVIAIAIVIALGLATAWFVYCQAQGGWPALDMPSFSAGGTWKLYCAK